MPDIGASELLLIVVVAILVIGPKDMPLALRTVGRWVGKMRKLSSHFRAGMDAMIREAEMEEMEKKWAAQNERIMREHPGTPSSEEMTGESPPAPKTAPAGADSTKQVPPPADAVPKPAANPASAEGGVKPAGD
tara:strand:+ start:290 stop:691 length:402 start_codon:yes stop_codon:yes gene_type:complete